VVKVANEMLTDLRVDVERDPGRKVVFPGRDGHSLAIGVGASTPASSVGIVLRRRCRGRLWKMAVRDVEQHLGKTFPPALGDPFRVGREGPA
jgi:hypothetical protein